jgi:transcriptional regulator with XRE-family HTH domain
MPGRRVRAQQVLSDPDKAELNGILRAFGENMRSLRATAGLSQDRLGERCFLAHGQISLMECGGAAPNLTVLLLLAPALGVSVGNLADGLESPRREASRARILALLARQPGLNTTGLARSLGLPNSYVLRITRYLNAYGEIVREQAGWRPGVEQVPDAPKL